MTMGNTGSTGSSGYRDAMMRCPRCAGELVQRDAGTSVIDVCKECDGIWIDWFDGDVAEIAGSTLAAQREPASRPTAATGAPLCPRCKRPLDVEHAYGTGPEILRCGECVGAFVPRASAEALLHFVPPEGGAPEEASFLEKLLARVRSAIGLG